MMRDLFTAMALLGLGAGCITDPAPGMFRGKDESRNLDCIRYSQARAHEMFPGEVPEEPVRSMPGTTSALVYSSDFPFLRMAKIHASGSAGEALICTSRFLRQTERDPRDEAILATLGQSVSEIIANVTAVAPAELTWQVDSFYPDPAVASKIAVAARMGLVERGQKVSDRVPVLAAGDIEVLSHLPPERAYALACGRYFTEHVLGERDAFLGLMIIDPREAQLHAGICTGGRWKWLQ